MNELHKEQNCNSLKELSVEMREIEENEPIPVTILEKENLMVTQIKEEGHPAPPDGGWGWVIVAASFGCNLILDSMTSSFAVLLPEIGKTFNAGNGQVAWVGSLLSGVSLFLGPIVSALTNKYGCRVVCVLGSIITTIAFICASFAPSLPLLLLSFGLFAGIGAGMIYLPAIVCVSYYFESKRARATGIAVSGSGIGAICAAPLVSFIIASGYTWRSVCLLFAGLSGCCCIFGGLMRPLQVKLAPIEEEEIDRTETNKFHIMKNGSIGGDSEYFLVKLPDGSMRKRPKLSLNADPGVYDGIDFDLVTPELSLPNTPIHPVQISIDILPRIDETVAAVDQDKPLLLSSNPPEKRLIQESQPNPFRHRTRLLSSESTNGDEDVDIEGVGGSFASRDTAYGTPRQRKYSISTVPSKSSFSSALMFQPSKSISRVDFGEDNISLNNALLLGKSSIFFQSKEYIQGGGASAEPVRILRPLLRKDIFYTGSVEHLPEFQSHASLTSYRQSILNIPKKVAADLHQKEWLGVHCPCSPMGTFVMTLRRLFDFSLLKNPVFLIFALAGMIGMLGFYVPIVFAIDFSLKKGFEPGKASFLLSVIGITSTFGRVGFGMLSDIPRVNSLALSNFCVILMGISTGILPCCNDYYLIVVAYTLFGIGLSGFIALSSVVLVDLLGLENLTNAFGLLIFFRGISSVVGPPLSGALYDYFQSYDNPFYLGGFFLVLAGIISFLAPLAAKYAPPKPVLQPLQPPHCTFQLEDIEEASEEYMSDEALSDNGKVDKSVADDDEIPLKFCPPGNLLNEEEFDKLRVNTC